MALKCYREAIKVFDLVIEIDSTFKEAYVLKGNSLKVLGEKK
jgi:hypothetical protein